MNSTVREFGGSTKGALPRSLLKDVADWRPAGLFDPDLLLADNLVHRIGIPLLVPSRMATGEAAETDLCNNGIESLQLDHFSV
jgi:hypothetical protein